MTYAEKLAWLTQFFKMECDRAANRGDYWKDDKNHAMSARTVL